MSKIRVGNKQNSILNGEWAGHVKHWMKQHTSGVRRAQDKEIIRIELENREFDSSKSMKKVKKIWRIEKSKIPSEKWEPGFGKYKNSGDALKATKSLYNTRGIGEFWRNYTLLFKYRIKNLETGEIIPVPKP